MSVTLEYVRKKYVRIRDRKRPTETITCPGPLCNGAVEHFIDGRTQFCGKTCSWLAGVIYNRIRRLKARKPKVCALHGCNGVVYPPHRYCKGGECQAEASQIRRAIRARYIRPGPVGMIPGKGPKYYVAGY